MNRFCFLELYNSNGEDILVKKGGCARRFEGGKSNILKNIEEKKTKILD